MFCDIAPIMTSFVCVCCCMYVVCFEQMKVDTKGPINDCSFGVKGMFFRDGYH